MLGDRFDRLSFDSDIARALLQYPWPLNVRELERAVGAASVMINDRVTLAAFGDRLRGEPTPPAAEAPPTKPLTRAEEPDRGSREHVVELLRLHRGNISGVARALCTSRTHVHRLLDRYGLTTGGKRGE
jgi:DNA-binding NtrC family response regulator